MPEGHAAAVSTLSTLWLGAPALSPMMTRTCGQILVYEAVQNSANGAVSHAAAACADID